MAILSLVKPSVALNLILLLTIEQSYSLGTTVSTMVKNKRQNEISIVGPEYIQVLQGRLLDKQVALILCGESHQDAIDVTRSGGVFDAKDGWIEMKKNDIFWPLFIEDPEIQGSDSPKNDILNKLMVQIHVTSKKCLTIEKAKEWAKDAVENLEIYGQVSFLWVTENVGARVPKGRVFLLSFLSKAQLDSYEEGDDDDSEEGTWINPKLQSDDLPSPVKDWLFDDDVCDSGKSRRSFEWGDLDLEAFQLNRRRLTDETIPTREIDKIVEARKKKLQEENIQTWDEWLAFIRKKNAENGEIDIDLILESQVPPWELSLHRPQYSAINNENYSLPHAAKCIRCVSEDEGEPIEDMFDPSGDGIGSYMDFIYRKFMEDSLLSNSNDEECTDWIHCVDMRDIGCEASVPSEMVKEKWMDTMLTAEEEPLREKLKNNAFLNLEPDAAEDKVKFVPENLMNPERVEVEKMFSSGSLRKQESGVDNDDDKEDNVVTFPSFESFFGQCTDFLYYSKHVKLCYAPFLAKCVTSLDCWEQFFTELFFGGTIPKALSLLSLDGGSNKPYFYVRSPIRQLWNKDTGSFEYHYRDDGEHFITNPFFPFIFYLYARDSNQLLPQTWSSNLFTRLCDRGDASRSIALAAKEWTLDIIKQNSIDPKNSDDKQSGGEWFEAFLYATHRDIYEDIDLSDSTVLLQKKKMKSLTGGNKHNIGKIKVPSCHEGFEEITQCLKKVEMNKNDATQDIVTPRIEVLAEILIDIWMSRLVDFATVLKIAEIVGNKKTHDKVVIVCYMGAAHTRAVSDFFVNCMGFKKKTFTGKNDYDEHEMRSLQLPKHLWEVAELFS